MNRIRSLLIGALIAGLCAAVVWQHSRYTMLAIRQAFADEQTAIFREMADKAFQALEQEPPDVESAVGYLKYAHCYYPSGTKQVHGSALDRIVERCRSLAEHRIVEMLRRTADVDLGPHAEAWIREFGTGDDFEGQL